MKKGEEEVSEEQKEINGEEILKRYFPGSEEINRMRNEVENFVSTAISQVDDFDIFLNCHSEILSQKPIHPNLGGGWRLEFKTPYGIWIVVLYINPIKKKSISTVEASYWLDEKGMVYSTGPDIKFSKDYVQYVRAVLPVFVEGMVKAFPEILTELQPILDAAPGVKKHRPNTGPYSTYNEKYCLDCGKLGSYWSRDFEDCVPIKKLSLSC